MQWSYMECTGRAPTGGAMRHSKTIGPKRAEGAAAHRCGTMRQRLRTAPMPPSQPPSLC